jgi:hypothetical protein
MIIDSLQMVFVYVGEFPHAAQVALQATCQVLSSSDSWLASASLGCA